MYRYRQIAIPENPPMFEDAVAKRIVLPLENLGLYVATYISSIDVPFDSLESQSVAKM